MTFLLIPYGAVCSSLIVHYLFELYKLQRKPNLDKILTGTSEGKLQINAFEWFNSWCVWMSHLIRLLFFLTECKFEIEIWWIIAASSTKWKTIKSCVTLRSFTRDWRVKTHCRRLRELNLLSRPISQWWCNCNPLHLAEINITMEKENI